MSASAVRMSSADDSFVKGSLWSAADDEQCSVLDYFVGRLLQAEIGTYGHGKAIQKSHNTESGYVYFGCVHDGKKGRKASECPFFVNVKLLPHNKLIVSKCNMEHDEAVCGGEHRGRRVKVDAIVAVDTSLRNVQVSTSIKMSSQIVYDSSQKMASTRQISELRRRLGLVRKDDKAVGNPS